MNENDKRKFCELPANFTAQPGHYYLYFSLFSPLRGFYSAGKNIRAA